MTSSVAVSIRRGLEEALAYAEGTADARRYGVHIPEDIFVKAIRAKLDITQEMPGAGPTDKDEQMELL